MPMRDKLSLGAVDLSELGAMVDSRDFGAAYLDPATGEIYPAFDGQVLGADGEPVDLEDVDWLAVGGRSSREAWLDMEDFAQAVADPAVSARLGGALGGRGAFRRFKDAIYDAPEQIGRSWNRFRDLRSQMRAIAWLIDEDLVTEREASTALRSLEASCQETLGGVSISRIDRSGARLILLNGMPGIGKSTLADRYAIEHPGVLHLDADRVRRMIGGDVADTAEPARVLALAMAGAHLRAGHDVVLPQLVARLDQIARFEEVARQAGASFVEVLIVDEEGSPQERFRRRQGDDPWHADVLRLVEREGGSARLAAYESGLSEVAAARAATLVLHAQEGDVDQTYAALLRLLG